VEGLAGFDFNVSHSGAYVVLASSNEGRVGVDVEAIEPVKIDDFRSVFSTKIIREIETSADSLREFYRYWTKLESAIKAEGCGLTGSVEGLSFEGDTVRKNGGVWRVKEVHLDSRCVCHVATEHLVAGVETIGLRYGAST
jgi:4'-phosphopantetheinyl transferase